jgi:hypothetical protein
MIRLESIPVPNPSILTRIIDNEAVLVLPEQGKIKVLNDVGAAIWELVDGKRRIQQISLEICEQFEVEQSKADLDTIHFIDELVKREIVTID